MNFLEIHRGSRYSTLFKSAYGIWYLRKVFSSCSCQMPPYRSDRHSYNSTSQLSFTKISATCISRIKMREDEISKPTFTVDTEIGYFSMRMEIIDFDIQTSPIFTWIIRKYSCFSQKLSSLLLGGPRSGQSRVIRDVLKHKTYSHPNPAKFLKETWGKANA